MNKWFIRRANIVTGGASPTPPSPGGLPAGYTELEYIENTGGSYLTTTIVPTATTGILAKYTSTNNNDRCIIGLREDSSTNSRFLLGKATNNYYGWGSYTAWSYQTKAVIGSLNWLNDGKAIVYDHSEVQQKSANLSTLPFTPVSTIGIFKGGGYYTNIWLGKIYYVKFSSGSTITNNFVPAKHDSTGEVGLYDIVGNEGFLTNQGTGDFSYGTL